MPPHLLVFCIATTVVVESTSSLTWVSWWVALLFFGWGCLFYKYCVPARLQLLRRRSATVMALLFFVYVRVFIYQEIVHVMVNQLMCTLLYKFSVFLDFSFFFLLDFSFFFFKCKIKWWTVWNCCLAVGKWERTMKN